VHAEAIRIHPFEDGNGRSTRALLNWILVRLGLRPIAFDIVKQEYLACLNHYYSTGDIQPLIDLCIRLSSGG
jgi:Fic family protein